MSKITEVILEPSEIFVSKKFLLKIKATRYATYEELQDKSYEEIKKNFLYKDLKGD